MHFQTPAASLIKVLESCLSQTSIFSIWKAHIWLVFEVWFFLTKNHFIVIYVWGMAYPSNHCKHIWLSYFVEKNLRFIQLELFQEIRVGVNLHVNLVRFNTLQAKLTTPKILAPDFIQTLASVKPDRLYEGYFGIKYPSTNSYPGRGSICICRVPSYTWW